MNKPLVSVIMPVYNGERFIGEAIESILSQTFGDWELIIVNDGSTDGSEKVIKRYLSDKRIRYLTHTTNLGVASASNTGLVKANGKYLALQDADDISIPERLEVQVDILESNEKCSLVFSRVLFTDVHGNILSRWGGAGLKEGLYSPSQIFYKLYLEGDFIPNISTMIRSLQIPYDTRLKLCNDYKRYLKICHDHFVYFLDRPLFKVRRGEYYHSLSSNKEALFGEEKRVLRDIYRMYCQDKRLRLTRAHYSQAMSEQLFKEARYYLSKNRQLKARLSIIHGLAVQPFKNGYMLKHVLPNTMFNLLQKIKQYSRRYKELLKLGQQKKRMKIAVVTNVFPALSETFILNQITGLLDLGCDIDIFAFRKSNEEKVHPDVKKYSLLARVTYFDEMPNQRSRRILKAAKIILRYFVFHPRAIIQCLNYKRYGGMYSALNNLVRIVPFLRKRYDVIHCHFGPVANKLIFLKDILPQLKFIISFHGYDIRLGLENGGRIYKRLFRHGDYFIANCAYNKPMLIKLGFPEHKIIYHPNGINGKKFSYNGQDKKGDYFVITTVARLVEEKNIPFALQVMKSLQEEKEYKFKYCLIGDGCLRDRIASKVGELGLEDIVILQGALSQDEVYKELAKTDIFFLSSKKESFGVVLLEAQAVGIPVVAANVGGVSEALQDRITGYLFSSQDTQEAKSKIIRLFKDHSLRKKMGQAGRKFIEDNFDIRQLNNRLVEIYKNDSQK